MASTRRLSVVLVVCLLANAFASPLVMRARPKRLVGYGDNELDSSERSSSESPELSSSTPKVETSRLSDPSGTLPPVISKSYSEMKKEYQVAPQSVPLDDDDDDEDFETLDPAPAGSGGSNLISLFNLGSSLLGGSSGANRIVRQMIRSFIRQYMAGGISFDLPIYKRRMDTKANEIDTDYADLPLKPPKSERQETDEETDSLEDSNDSSESDEDSNNAAEESLEDDKEPDAVASNASVDNSDYDSDEPPGGGDGQGGGILGVLAGLSGGGEESDLGSLLAAVSGIVANLSGDGFDLNALIASGIGLFVGLLSEGEENPGAVISSYLLTSLDTITGGGAKNNGEFLGTFLSKLIKGTSAASSGPQTNNILTPIISLKVDIIKAILKFGSSLIAMASAGSGGV